MGEHLEGKWVVPNPQIPRTFGMMNLVFGVLLLLTAAGYLAWFVYYPRFQAQMVTRLKNQAAAQKAQREAKLAELKSNEQAAKTREKAAKTKEDAEKAKEEKDSIVEERVALEDRVEPDLSAMTDLMSWDVMADMRLKIYYLSETISSILLNVLMAISGGGLLALAEWGRRLAIGVAWLKIVRWVCMIFVTMVLILPMTMEKTDKMFQSIQTQVSAKSGGPAAVPMVGFGQITAIFGAIVMVFGALVASIYPVLSLWFLTRPPTRAACYKVPKPSGGEQRSELGELA